MKLVAAALFALSLGFVACGGSGGSPPSAADAGAGAGSVPFMGDCELGHNEQCSTNLCFNYNSKGPKCTHACTMDSDCEAPSPGCSGMGVCKAPGGGTGSGSGSGSGTGH